MKKQQQLVLGFKKKETRKVTFGCSHKPSYIYEGVVGTKLFHSNDEIVTIFDNKNTRIFLTNDEISCIHYQEGNLIFCWDGIKGFSLWLGGNLYNLVVDSLANITYIKSDCINPEYFDGFEWFGDTALTIFGFLTTQGYTPNYPDWMFWLKNLHVTFTDVHGDVDFVDFKR